MEDEHNHHLLRQARKNGSQAEEDSRAHSPSQAELHSSSSSRSHEHHLSHSAHSETPTSMATTSMFPASINYNVNVQFEPATPQAGKPRA